MTPELLKQIFANELPPDTAFRSMHSYVRETPAQARLKKPPPRESAVMLLLFPRHGIWNTLFMLRPEGKGAHSGQLSFPGGKRENSETFVQTALRETYEETGLEPHAVEVIGELNEVYIPPSHFIVKPFAGIVYHEPVFKPNPQEVVQLIEHPIEEFLQENIIRQKEIFLPVYKVHFMSPYFDVQGHTLWGATAMMVQELRIRAGFYR